MNSTQFPLARTEHQSLPSAVLEDRGFKAFQNEVSIVVHSWWPTRNDIGRGRPRKARLKDLRFWGSRNRRRVASICVVIEQWKARNVGKVIGSKLAWPIGSIDSSFVPAFSTTGFLAFISARALMISKDIFEDASMVVAETGTMAGERSLKGRVPRSVVRLKQTIRTMSPKESSGSKTIGTLWTWARLWPNLMSSMVFGFRIWDPGDTRFWILEVLYHFK